ncbi:unnamed protein product [Symbiodinium sp. CCMP2592]|nr:unnamed protein product [Symbiodinium sp. CCMP2592]
MGPHSWDHGHRGYCQEAALPVSCYFGCRSLRRIILGDGCHSFHLCQVSDDWQGAGDRSVLASRAIIVCRSTH